MKSKFILVTLIFFILFSFLLSSYSAANIEFDYFDEHYSLPELNLHENTFVYFNGAKFDGFDIFSFSGSDSQMSFRKSTDDKYPNSVNFSFVAEAEGSYVYWYRYDIKSKTFSCLYDNQFYQKGKGFSGGNITGVFVYSTFDLKDNNGLVFFNKVNQSAFIENKSQIETGKFTKVIINAADYTDREFYLLTYYYSENTDNPFDVMIPRKIIDLKIHNNFYVGTKNEKAIYEVPLSHTGIELKER